MSTLRQHYICLFCSLVKKKKMVKIPEDAHIACFFFSPFSFSFENLVVLM